MTDSSVDPETPPSTAPDDASSPKPGRKRGLTVLILILLFLGGLGGGAVAYIGPARLMSLVTASAEGAAEKAEPGTSAEAGTVDTGERKTFLMEDHIVNLISGSGPSTRFVRVRTALIYNPVALPAEELDRHKPRLRDAFHGFLSQLTERDLEGSYGLAMVREELLRRSRAVVGSDAVREILITDLVIQ
jgi:flagellar FliL protein